MARNCFINSIVKLGLDQKEDETTQHAFLDFGIFQALLSVKLQMMRQIVEENFETNAVDSKGKISWEKIDNEEIFCSLIKQIKTLSEN